jgi:ketol-acid reductoisomerase
MAIYFSEPDVDPDLIKSLRVAVIGYGNQGHAHAQNLRDSGVEVRVGLHETSKSRATADREGFEVLSVADATRWADVLMFCTPDVAMGDIYCDQVVDQLRAGQTLLFAHGFNIHYKLINPPPHVNVGMVSPKGPGRWLRGHFLEGKGLAALVAVHQDPEGLALQITLSYAWAIGSFRSVVLQTTFQEECEADMFGEQAVLCGGISALIKASFETLVAAGYQPELAYFECLHETKLITDLIYEGGIAHMHRAISDTAEWGDFVSGPEIIGPASREAMERVLERIRSGRFAEEWIAENRSGLARMKRFRELDGEHPSEAVGAELRERMFKRSA